MLDFLKNGKGEILNFFFKNPDGEYYLREIAKYLNKEPASYQRYLDSLVEDGILVDERRGNLRFFKLNKNHALYEELKSIVSKTLGIESHLNKLVNSLDNIDVAFIFGSIANNKEVAGSDIDLMIVGNPNQDQLIEGITKLEKILEREINYQIYSQTEVIDKLSSKDSFFVNIFKNHLILLKGNVEHLQKLAGS